MTFRSPTFSAAALVAVACLLASGCGGGGRSGTDTQGAAAKPAPPVGVPRLPDLAPAPPGDIQMQRTGTRWNLRFSSILVNIGKGDFILRATRDKSGKWHVEQDIPYSKSGAKPTPVPAQVVWGGDGHHHWHIKRIAAVRLVPYRNGRVAFSKKALIDSKIGFCFYDFSRLLGGPENPVYSRLSCGHTTHDTQIGMGLSVGWVDDYSYVLPGQSIDVTNLPDGKYRLYATVDDQHWFHEAKRSNDLSWADIGLSTKANGARVVRVLNPGPAIH